MEGWRMTWPQERLGDKGQRYKVEAEGYPSGGWNPIGYCETYTGAEAMAKSIMLAPSCTAGRITDRSTPDGMVVTLRHN